VAATEEMGWEVKETVAAARAVEAMAAAGWEEGG
jgi:hypothetical protein